MACPSIAASSDCKREDCLGLSHSSQAKTCSDSGQNIAPYAKKGRRRRAEHKQTTTNPNKPTNKTQKSTPATQNQQPQTHSCPAGAIFSGAG